MEQGVPWREVRLETAVHTARWWARGHRTIATPVTTFRYFTGYSNRTEESALVRCPYFRGCFELKGVHFREVTSFP